jgi:hypothetical protein
VAITGIKESCCTGLQLAWFTLKCLSKGKAEYPAPLKTGRNAQAFPGSR